VPRPAHSAALVTALQIARIQFCGRRLRRSKISASLRLCVKKTLNAHFLCPGYAKGLAMRILQIRFKNLNSLVGEWEIDLTHPAYVSDGIFAITGPTG